jgi:ABC-type lipoprotein release transport system permease subunit
MEQPQEQSTGFQKLLLSMMNRRWLMTLIVLITFMAIAVGILLSIHTNSVVSGEWKELLLLLLGALIGSYGKIIDYWFSDTDKDKMLVQKMDEEDGESLSNTGL